VALTTHLLLVQRLKKE